MYASDFEKAIGLGVDMAEKQLMHVVQHSGYGGGPSGLGVGVSDFTLYFHIKFLLPMFVFFVLRGLV